MARGNGSSNRWCRPKDPRRYRTFVIRFEQVQELSSTWIVFTATAAELFKSD